MEDYQVGQIIFLIGEKTTRVLPIQVVEEVVRTTIEGKIKTYTVKMPDKNGTTVDIYELKGTLFKDKKELRAYMLTNAKNAIDSMLASSEVLSEEVFGVSIKEEKADTTSSLNLENFNQVPEVEKSVQNLPDDGIIRVDLGNGQFAKMNSSSLDDIKQT